VDFIENIFEKCHFVPFENM
jgi:hypothetical protein